MNEQHLRQLLTGLQRGDQSLDAVVERLKTLPFDDMGFARYDTHRALRRGFPEVVLGEGKTAEQIARIMERAASQESSLLCTRVSADLASGVRGSTELELEYDAVARCLVYGRDRVEPNGRGRIVVACAGTSDLPVAAEAALTAELMGNEVERIVDVGVAGLHRILAVREQLEAASVIIVVAGMEGALASVVAGLVARPVIAVPTSVGYGSHLGGVVPLLGMLNACAPGITVVNIDNGFGAGYAAALMNRERVPAHTDRESAEPSAAGDGTGMPSPTSSAHEPGAQTE